MFQKKKLISESYENFNLYCFAASPKEKKMSLSARVLILENKIVRPIHRIFGDRVPIDTLSSKILYFTDNSCKQTSIKTICHFLQFTGSPSSLQQSGKR